MKKVDMRKYRKSCNRLNGSEMIFNIDQSAAAAMLVSTVVLVDFVFPFSMIGLVYLFLLTAFRFETQTKGRCFCLFGYCLVMFERRMC